MIRTSRAMLARDDLLVRYNVRANFIYWPKRLRHSPRDSGIQRVLDRENRIIIAPGFPREIAYVTMSELAVLTQTAVSIGELIHSDVGRTAIYKLYLNWQFAAEKLREYGFSKKPEVPIGCREWFVYEARTVIAKSEQRKITVPVLALLTASALLEPLWSPDIAPYTEEDVFGWA